MGATVQHNKAIVCVCVCVWIGAGRYKPGTLISVSYTHLDVYKRQAVLCKQTK